MQNRQLRNGSPWKSLLARFCLVLAFFAWGATAVLAAPMNGREVTLRQPDGSNIKVKAFGDEFFNWLETDDGHVVVYDSVKCQYAYAQLSATGDEYESTGIAVGKSLADLSKQEQDRVQKLEKKIRISEKSRRAKIDRGLKHLSRDASGRLVLPSVQPAYSVQMAPSADGSTTNDVPPPPVLSVNPIAGSFKALALLVYFPDFTNEVTVTRGEVDNFFNVVPYSGDLNATSVRQYFQIHSQNKMDISHAVTEWFAAPNNKAYYNVPTPTLWTRFDELAIYRLEQLKAEGFDFRQLDANGDGAVDCISLFYAGGWLVGGWAGGLTWSGFAAYGLSTSCPYQVSPLEDPLELAVVCHELGHAAAKFPDLYPYDGNAADAGIFCLMAGGNWSGGGHHPAAVCGPMKYQASWVSAVDVTASGLTSHGLTVGGTNVIRYVNPDNSKEYFLFEMRGEVGYEGIFGGSAVEVCPSRGLVAYHVKEDGSNSGSSIFTTNNPNCNYSRPPMVLVLEDNPQTTYVPWYDKPTLDGEDAFDTGDQVNGNTTPNFNFWTLSGRTIDSGIGVTGIQIGSSNLTFSIFNRNPPLITASLRVVLTNGVTTLSVGATGMVSYAWSKVSGPGAVTFGSSNAVVTTATFGNSPGSYLLRVTMSDGVNQIVSQISIQVIAGVSEYLGYYKSLPVGNNWHIGWVEFVSNKLRWRNAANSIWTLTATANPDVYLTDSSCPYGAGLQFSFVRENGQVTKFTFNGGTYSRCNPVANNMTVGTLKNTPVSITLTATDVENEAVTYFVVTNPTKGTLTGTVPNLTYRPSTNYMGGDCFTFKATDGVYTSNLATVSIDVNAIPLVDAGTNKTVMLSMGFVPGLYYGTAAGDMNTTTPNPKTERLINVGSKTEDSIGANTTEIYTGQIYDANGSISFTENIDDKARIWIDGALVISNDSWGTRTSTTNLNLAPGWHDIEIRIGNASGGSGPAGGIGIGYDPAGSTNWMTLADPGDGSFLRVLGRSASVPLDGTITDSDGDPLKTTWSKISGPGTVSLGNIYLVDTTAAFIEAGTYVFRLSADDGSIVTNDDIVITILNESPAVDFGAGASLVSATSALLQGTLTAGLNANAWICWGMTDGGTVSTGSWEHVVSVGTVTQGVAFASLVTGLSTNTTYFYRCCAASASGTDWSDTALTFNGSPVGGGGLWTPAELTVAAWYDAADANTILKNGSAVTNWLDKSGNGLRLSQTNASFQPATGATINSLNAINFTGDIMATASNPFSPTVSNAFVIAVHKVDTIANGTFFSLTGSSANRWQSHAPYGGDILYFDCGGAASPNRINTTYGVSAGSSALVSFYCSTAANVQQVYKNGALLVGDSSGHAVNTAGNITVGGVETSYQDTTLGEFIIIKGTVNTTTREKLEGYLAHKWGLQGNLPSNHLYKATAPSGAGAIGNLAPTGIGASAATFNSSLIALGTNYTVYVYYGTINGGTNAGSWAASALVRAWTNVAVNVSYTASLQSGTKYYYTFMASNTLGRAWASPSWTFRTLGTPPAVTLNHAVPIAWLASRNAAWASDYEGAAMGDPDNDGYLTWEEYWSGTDPQNSNSFLKIDTVSLAGSSATLQWRHAAISNSIPAITVQTRTNLSLGSWVPVGLKTPVNGTNIWVGSLASPQLFYRLAVTNAP
jgi:M6 family metalloprotease-like protein